MHISECGPLCPPRILPRTTKFDTQLEEPKTKLPTEGKQINGADKHTDTWSLQESMQSIPYTSSFFLRDDKKIKRPKMMNRCLSVYTWNRVKQKEMKMFFKFVLFTGRKEAHKDVVFTINCSKVRQDCVFFLSNSHHQYNSFLNLQGPGQTKKKNSKIYSIMPAFISPPLVFFWN